MRKGLVIVGVILLVIGLLLAVVGMLPGLTAVKASDIEYDATSGFADYDDGDEVIITGEITEEGQEMGGYSYMLDNNVPVLAGEDIGDVGDTVTLQCTVEGMSVMGITVEYMNADAIYQTMNALMIIGIILLIVGIIVMILGFKGGAAAPVQQQPPMEPQYQQPYQQPPPQQPPMPPQ